jgi:uncharacterized protein (TIGR03083 family)
VKQNEIVNGLREERETLRQYLDGLDDEAWDRDSLCEGWRVRDVVAHLAGNCADVVAGNLDDVGSTAHNQRQVDERAGRNPADLLAEWDEAAPQVEALYANIPNEMWDAELPPPLGTVGRGVLRHLEDLWVHAQDIRIPLDGEAVPGPGTRATLEIAALMLADRCFRFAPDVSSLTIEAGDFSATIECEHGSDSFVVSGGPVTIALVATGRVPLAVALDEGSMTVTPDPPNGFADAFNLYGA